MQCPNPSCQKHNINDDHCDHCGTPLQVAARNHTVLEDPRSITCPNCHRDSASGPYCHYCGTSLPTSGKRETVFEGGDHGSSTQAEPGERPGGRGTGLERGVAANRRIVGFLASFDGTPNGKVWLVFAGKMTIGTDARCDIVIDNDDTVSGVHAIIRWRDGSLDIQDQMSTNGTYLEGKKVLGAAVADGALLGVGRRTRLMLRLLDARRVTQVWGAGT